MGHSDFSHMTTPSSAASAKGKCCICGCKLQPAEGDDVARRVCASCGTRPEAGRLGEPCDGAAETTIQKGAREFTPAELALIRRVHALMPLPQLLAILNERLMADLGPDAAPYTQAQLQAAVAGWSVPGTLGSQDWAATRKFLANARAQGILDRIDEGVINAFAVVYQLSPKQVLLLKDVILGS
jgi:hypothetical protein